MKSDSVAINRPVHSAISFSPVSYRLNLFYAISSKLSASDIIKLTDIPIKERNTVAETLGHSTPARHLTQTVSIDGKFPRSGRRKVVLHFLLEQTTSLLRV